jgi:hypothetical protein
LSYEILIGDGSVITASPTESPELFYGIAGSYGTLGVILSVEIKLVAVEPWVLLEYKKFTHASDAIDFMVSCNTPDYLEGIVFGKDQSIVISGSCVKEEELPRDVSRLSLKHYWSKWFYQIARDRFNSGVATEAIPIRDYLFRHDRAAFWIGGYALHPRLLFRYTLEWMGHCPEWLHRLLMKKKNKMQFRSRDPSWLFRILFGWTMDSAQLYRFLHHGTEQWFAEHFAIQDYYIPVTETAEFVNFVLDKYGIVPLWLCPIKATTTPQLLSPHYAEGSPLLFDVGVYGLPAGAQEGKTMVSDIDKKAYALRGKKMFYSQTYFSKDEFWRYYPKEKYEALRSKYFSDQMYLDITKKILYTESSL